MIPLNGKVGKETIQDGMNRSKGMPPDFLTKPSCLSSPA